MGRKSDKGKDKKIKRKEEAAKLKDLLKIVDKANEQVDPMEHLQPFKKFERNDLKLTISSHRATDMDEQTLTWAFELTKENMQQLYELSEWGWSDRQKYEEMTDERAWYLLARDEDNKPVAMVHFRFDLEFDVEVLYCYEIQLTAPVRRKGLGKFLMQILELLAHKAEMKKVMCTVFTNNKVSKSFFVDKLKYEVDETSPEETEVEAWLDEEGYSYMILCKPIVPKSKGTTPKQNTTAAAATNGCSNGHSHGHSHCQAAH